MTCTSGSSRRSTTGVPASASSWLPTSPARQIPAALDRPIRAIVDLGHSRAGRYLQRMVARDIEYDTQAHPTSSAVEAGPRSSADEWCCPIVELRQYSLRPAQRDVLIDLFEREFIESQEAAGMRVLGQFRDLGDPDRFVWFRGFRDMPSRAAALGAFYGGPVWKAHREAANATMIDSDNVLLLRPARPGSEFLFGNDRPGSGTQGNSKRLIVANIYYFDAPVTEDFIGFFED